MTCHFAAELRQGRYGRGRLAVHFQHRHTCKSYVWPGRLACRRCAVGWGVVHSSSLLCPSSTENDVRTHAVEIRSFPRVRLATRAEVTDSEVQTSCRVLDAVHIQQAALPSVLSPTTELGRDVAVADQLRCCGTFDDRVPPPVRLSGRGDVDRRLRCAYATFCWPFSYCIL